ncbi:MAG: tetratricopeptide repeat protein [Verrucomicrobiota bacterium]
MFWPEILVALIAMNLIRIFIAVCLTIFCSAQFSLHSSHAQAAEPTKEYIELYAKAKAEFDGENYQESLKILEEAIALEPQLVHSYNLKGAVLVKLDEYDQAAETFQQVLAIQPENVIANYNMGESFFLAEKYSQAKEQFQVYLNSEGNQTNALARYKVILCDLLGGNESAARKAVEELRPTISHPLQYYGRAAIHFHAGEEEEARSYLKSAFNIYPAGLNLAFSSSFLELGWLKEGEVAEVGAVHAAGLQSLSTEFHPEIEKDDSGALREKFESLLPSLGGDEN